MKKTNLFLSIAVLGIAVAFSSCNKEEMDDKETPINTPTLYSRLGGINAISAVVDQFLANVASNDEINGRFAETVANEFRLITLRNHLVDQICEATGGPCIYKGQSMKESHEGMGITEAEFTSMAVNLIDALNQFNVPQKEADELFAIIASTKDDIVEM
jgi:hemoglobin